MTVRYLLIDVVQIIVRENKFRKQKLKLQEL